MRPSFIALRITQVLLACVAIGSLVHVIYRVSH